MQKAKVTLNPLTLVGLTVRTQNKDEVRPETSKIGPLFGSYLGNQLANELQHRSNPGVTYAVYTDYESDEHGPYTYFIGEAVDSLDDQDLSQFKSLVIPASAYQKFTSESGKMPDILLASWQQIWHMDQADFGGKRRYIADFEVYDHRAKDPNKTTIDIYIGLE
jgi:predicted transcriptional regulator YdeE